MKKWFLFFLLFLSLIIYSDDLQKLIKNSPSRLDYPNADIVYLKYDITKDGRALSKDILHVHKVIKILTYAGREEYGELRVPFDKGQTKVKIIKARTYYKGKWYEVDRKKAINKLSRFSALSSGNYYPNARVLVVVFPQVGIDSVIDFEYVLERVHVKKKKKEKSYYAGIITPQQSEPILNYKLTYYFDNEKDLKIVLKNDNKKYDYTFGVKEEKNYKILTFKADEIPQIIYESHMPRISEFSPTIVYSDYTSWQEYANRVLRKIKTKEKYKGKVFKSEDALLKFITENIRDVFFPYTESGFKPYKLKKILKNKYAGEVDKAYLFYKILKRMGKNPKYAFVRKSKPLFPEFIIPSFYRFSVYCNDKVYNIFSDSLNYKNCQYYNGKALILDKKIKWIDLPKNKNEKITVLTLTINKDGSASGNLHYIFKGRNSSVRAGYRSVEPARMQKRMENKINSIFNTAQLVNYKLLNINNRKKSPEIIINFKIPYLLSFIKNKAFLRLPFISFKTREYFNKQDRKFNFKIYNSNDNVSITKIQIKLNGLKFAYIPKSMFFKEKCFNNSITYKKSDKVLDIEVKYETHPPCELTLKEYFKIKNEIDNLAASIEDIMLKK